MHTAAQVKPAKFLAETPKQTFLHAGVARRVVGTACYVLLPIADVSLDLFKVGLTPMGATTEPSSFGIRGEANLYQAQVRNSGPKLAELSLITYLCIRDVHYMAPTSVFKAVDNDGLSTHALPKERLSLFFSFSAQSCPPCRT